MCRIANNAMTRARRRLGKPAAFTLIELLVVMFILAILVALVASVGGYVMRSANEKDTAATQAILMDAIQAWHDKDTNTPKQYPDDAFPDAGDKDGGTNLIRQLTGTLPVAEQSPRVRAARDILLKLPKEAWSGGGAEPVKDSWGKSMQYKHTGGLGGRPVIISAGPDGQFNSPYDEDNIRSDESQ